MQHSTGFSVLADRRKLLVAYPQGLVQAGGHTTGWDASGPLDPAARGVDDGLFVSDLLNVLQARYALIQTGSPRSGSPTEAAWWGTWHAS